MQSPLKTILVYDLETGGFSEIYNPITEFAGVVISTETLEIIEEFSVMFRPRLDLRHIEEEANKEAKKLFKALATKNEESNINSLYYKGKNITLKSLETLETDIENFKRLIESRGKNGHVITYEDYLKILETEYSDIAKIYFDFSYSPQALEVTHITLEMMLEEGVEFEEGFRLIKELILRHTIGTAKPILSGHNIKEFDNPFTAKLFVDNKDDLSKYINKFMIDTLEWVRLRWFELSSFSLGVCANELGLTLKEAHRALPDTVANAKLLIKLIKSLKGEGSQESTYTRRKFDFQL